MPIDESTMFTSESCAHFETLSQICFIFSIFQILLLRLDTRTDLFILLGLIEDPISSVSSFHFVVPYKLIICASNLRNKGLLID